jgi:glycosyltransferase involved in cell wall biosynthesis
MTRVLMIGLGASAPMYYRILLPARARGWDYVGVLGEPPELRYCTGLVDGDSKMPDWLGYDVVVVQQAHGPAWRDFIKALRANGTTVLYEIDDYVHGVRHVPGHMGREVFTPAFLAGYEMCMKASDALIVSTPTLGQLYRPFNRRHYVCRNGLDLGRYALTRPGRDTVNVGWAGATGHDDAILPWLEEVAVVMGAIPNVRFVSIGRPFARSFQEVFGADRATAVPFTSIENYPAAMTLLDVALAPAGRTGFHRAKSDLRWLEAGALGIPIIADPFVYGSITDGVDGLLASDPRELAGHLASLVGDRDLRMVIGENARSYVRRERDVNVTAEAWADAVERRSFTPA